MGKASFAMLLFEDLALVPMIFLIEVIGGHADTNGLLRTAGLGILVVAAMLVVGRFVLSSLFAQAARTKNPELFLAISLLTVILASLATGAVGLSPILGALDRRRADRGNRLSRRSRSDHCAARRVSAWHLPDYRRHAHRP